MKRDEIDGEAPEPCSQRGRPPEPDPQRGSAREPAPAPSAAATPVMSQFLEIKAAHPDALLFYRMGDFYELFFDDAVVAARALGIVLTKRGKHLGEDIPMCGVPVQRADEYLARLIALGHRVAVCEQLEDPAEARRRGSKAVLRRDVVRLVTAGTLTEDGLLERARPNWLLAIARLGAAARDARFGLAWADLSTGAFRVAESDAERLSADLARIDPAEIVVPDHLLDDAVLIAACRVARPRPTPLPRPLFDGATAAARLASFYGVATVDSFGAFGRAELAAAGGLVSYVERTQSGARARFEPPVKESTGDVMIMDAATRANLELLRAASGERGASLIGVVDETLTAAGARLLAERIASPLTDPERISARLDAVAWLVAEPDLRRGLRESLEAAPDMARALSRLALKRGSPCDLRDIGRGIAAACAIARRIGGGERLSPEIAAARAALAACPKDLGDEILATLVDEPPPDRAQGGFVRAGCNADLDETRRLRDESRRLIAGLEATYAAETGIRGLKIRHNAVLGWFVEASATQAERLLAPPHSGRFVHRQTLAGAVRFSTAELADLASRIAAAADRALALEIALFDALAARVIAAAAEIGAAANALAVLDVAASAAEIAAKRGWRRPLVDRSLAFRIKAGRHPVVEAALGPAGGDPFVPNDCDIGPPGNAEAGRIVLLTGPNMGGKSTWLRQNALIAILAQAGLFVPAAEAHIGAVDRLFSRVGAADDLARGRSTFMVEMVETAAILNQAGPRALVILDEIGRGTATFDGLSIAWATIEHLHEANRARALFATHFHELTALAAKLPRLVNMTVRVKEWRGEVVFLHEIVPGAADRSYGVQVARLAGLPAAVVARARQVLKTLEKAERDRPRVAFVDDLPLFSAARRMAPEEPPKPAPAFAALLAEIAALDPDAMSPREALEALYRLKSRASGLGEEVGEERED